MVVIVATLFEPFYLPNIYNHFYVLRLLLLLGRAITNLESVLKSRDITLPTKVRIVKAIVFPVVMWMWELDHKESWAPKNRCLTIVVLEKVPESPLDNKEIKPLNPKEIQPWIGTHWKDWCWSWNSNTLATWCKEPIHWKRPLWWTRLRARGDRVTENEMVGWHHWFTGHEFEQTQGDSEGHRSLTY